jgi:hypothetical protein
VGHACPLPAGLEKIEHVMNGLGEDIQYAGRSLLRSPTLTLVIVLTLALGIGLNTAIFSVVRGVLLKPLAFRDPSRLMIVSGRITRPDNRPALLSGGMFSRVGAAVPAFSDVVAVAAIRQNLRADGLPVQVQVGWVSANFFSLLGVDAAMGRRFADHEPPRRGHARPRRLAAALQRGPTQSRRHSRARWFLVHGRRRAESVVRVGSAYVAA